MPVFQRMLNLNTVFSQLTETPVIINELPDATEEEREKIQDLISTRYSGDMISLLPSCRCGATKTEASIGVICQYCGTVVKSSLEDEIEPTVWFRKPDGVEKLISPIVWIMLKQRFKKSGFNIIQWLCDVGYKPKVKQPQVIGKLIDAGVQRGYNNFVRHFDTIMGHLFSLKDFRLKKNQVDFLHEFLKQNRDAIFSDYIPLPNKSLLIIEKTNVGTYVDSIIVGAVDAIQMLVSIDRNFYDQNPRVKENRTARALSKLSDFYEKYYKTNLSPKPGQFRRHVFGTRTNFSFRAVISSLTDTHSYKEVHVPWGIGLTAFRPHVLNKLLRLGMDHNSAIGMILGHVEKYHPLLDGILKEIIAEAPGAGPTIILQRNPSLLQGSAITVNITKFKTDPDDHTIGMSILVVKLMNADFDGDCVNCSIALDEYLAKRLYPLEPKFNIFQLNKPHEVSGMIAIPKPVISSISSWLEEAA